MLLLGFPGPSQRNSRDGQGPQYLTNKKNKCSYSLFSFPFSFPSFFSFLFPPFFPFFPFFPSFFLFSFFLFFQGGPRAPLEAPRITGPSKKVRVDTPVSGPGLIMLNQSTHFQKLKNLCSLCYLSSALTLILTFHTIASPSIRYCRFIDIFSWLDHQQSGGNFL